MCWNKQINHWYEPLKLHYNIFILSLDQTDFVLLGDACSDKPHKEAPACSAPQFSTLQGDIVSVLCLQLATLPQSLQRNYWFSFKTPLM